MESDLDSKEKETIPKPRYEIFFDNQLVKKSIIIDTGRERDAIDVNSDAIISYVNNEFSFSDRTLLTIHYTIDDRFLSVTVTETGTLVHSRYVALKEIKSILVDYID
jgi:hypothetical protein